MSLNQINGVNLSPAYDKTNLKNYDIKAQSQKEFFSSEATTSVDTAKFANNTAKNTEKVSFGEGIKLIGKGFINKAKDIFKSIIKHPIKTLAIVGATTLALGALPLIGISTAVGASVLAIGCAGIAVGKTITHTIKAVKHNNNGEYDEMRNDLQNIGGDCLDLALSMPFVPKAFKTLKRNIKFAPSMGINKELIGNIKNAKGIGAKYTELLKGDLRINYETLGNEMGLKVKPKLVFDDTMPFDLAKGSVSAGEYEPTTGVMKINPKMLNPVSKLITKTNPEAILKHELTHFQQFSDIARTEGIGIAGLKNNLSEYYKKGLDIGCLLDRADMAKNMATGDQSVFNTKFYEDVVKSQGTISAGTKEAIATQTYIDGLIGKVTTDVEAIKNLKINPFFQTPADMKKILNVYKANPLETPAYAAQDMYAKNILRFRPNIFTDIIMGQSVSNNQSDS